LKNRVLVTGGAGFIGSHLTDRLVKAGNDVFVLDNFCSGNMQNLAGSLKSGDLQIVRGDIRDFKTVTSLVKKVDSVFHLAVQCLVRSLTHPLEVHEINATGTMNVCRACHEHGNKRLLYVSSSEVYGSAVYVPMDEKHPMNPTTPYGASKAAGEMYVRSFHNSWNMPAAIVRPFNTYGPRCRKDRYSAVITKFVDRAMRGLPPIIHGDGKQTRDFTYVSDTVEGIIKAAECDDMLGEAVNIARAEEVPIMRLAQIVMDMLDENNEWSPVFKKERKGDVRRHMADISKAKRIVNFKPSVSIEEGIGKYVDWVKQTKPKARKR
jgi:UDP-glucose 4-epimerase